ncbi:MAG: AAA-like domain-containing protein [Leptolyngbyaceae cyanobacterium]
MDVHQALSFVEHQLARRGEKPLTDIERDVFIGSWEGRRYKEIHPVNPEYVEKCVAHILWKRLTKVLEERVSKRSLRGAIDRSIDKLNIKRVFISYQGQEPNRVLADQLYAFLKNNGHLPFASNLDAIASLPAQAEPPELVQTDQKRQSCDCFILLVSSAVAVSEIATEELRQLRDWRSDRGKTMPLLIAILINVPQYSLLSHDLRQYLNGAILWQWHSEIYTPKILDAIRQILDQGTVNLSSGQTAPTTTDLLLPVAPATSEIDPSRETDPESVLPPTESPNPRITIWPESPEDKAEQPAYATPFATVVPISVTTESTSSSPNGWFTGHDHDMAQVFSSEFYPLPTAEPEVPKGLVQLESIYYVERPPCEIQCYDAIQRPGALVRIKAPRQMGKTSLMARILKYAKEQGYQAIPLSFQLADRATFQNLTSLLRWFCMKVARKLGIPHRLDEYWEDTFGAKDNCTYYFEEYLLPEIDGPLVLGLDEVDCVFQYPIIADDFFGLLRAWYEEAGYGIDGSKLWEKLRLVVVHSTEVYIPLDVNQSPFNVGLPIELTEFTPQQVLDLAQRHHLAWSMEQVTTLMMMVGGHPYLVRLAMYYIARGQTTLELLCHSAPTEAGIYDDHLRRHLWHLTQHPDLASAYHLVLNADQPMSLDSERAFKLHSLGLVHFRGNGIVPSFDLYRQYFRDRLPSPPTSPLEP